MAHGLNPENMSPHYTLGRLFFLYENLQWRAVGDKNSTIKDKFFRSVAQSPARIFPVLIKKGETHLKTLGGAGINNAIEIQELMGRLESFPRTQSLWQQGEFYLGYMHQKQHFFNQTKNTND